MSGYEKFQTEDRRLVILRILAESDGYRCNEYLLKQLLEVQGHAVSKDRLRTDLGWLQEQGLLKELKQIGETTVATLNDRGLDVSNGLTTVAGVKRPAAGD